MQRIFLNKYKGELLINNTIQVKGAESISWPNEEMEVEAFQVEDDNNIWYKMKTKMDGNNGWISTFQARPKNSPPSETLEIKTQLSSFHEIKEWLKSQHEELYESIKILF